MKVTELIKLLKSMPQDADIITEYKCCCGESIKIVNPYVKVVLYFKEQGKGLEGIEKVVLTNTGN